MAATNFPFTLGTPANAKDASGHVVRFNFKNDGTYSIASGISTGAGPIIFQGYNVTPGDGGKAIIDGGSTNATLFAAGAVNVMCIDLIVQNNATGSGDAFQTSSVNTIFYRCVANNVRGNGFNLGATQCALLECEAYACNKANAASTGGFVVSGSCSVINCIAHDNAGSNTDGFVISATATPVLFWNCISDTNGRHGFAGAIGSGVAHFFNCDAYNNGADGIKNTNTTLNSWSVIRNCNFIKNVGWGVNSSITTGRWYGLMDNCGFGSGTQVNGGGTTNGTDAIVISGSITYASGVTPWVDPANGDFRINLPAAINAGLGRFTETAASYAGSVGYPDIGAVQHYDVQKGHTFGG